MIFLTVGSRYGFDRLVRAVDDLVRDGVIDDVVVAQIGVGSYEPKHMQFERFMEGTEYDGHVRDATMLLGHAGSGTIQLALAHQKPLLVLPRRKRFKEHVNDHQVATARTFERLGQILAAYEANELPRNLAHLREFVPQQRVVRTDALVGRIGEFLQSLNT